MMLRITRLESADAVLTLRLEGWLTEQTASELQTASAAALAERSAVLLDVGAVRFADEPGAALLRQCHRDGCVIIGTTPFLAEMLDRDAARDRSSAGEATTDEARLLAELRAGSGAAFERLVRENTAALLAVARRLLPSEEEARDAVQEAFLSAFKGIAGFGGGAKLSTWLHRIVVNAALMRLRTRRRRPEEPIDDLLPCFDGTGHWVTPTSRWEAPTEAEVESREVRVAVRRCIDRLPETHRTVLLLRDIEELDTEETAAVLGVSPNAVKIRLHRARQALRTLLEADLGRDARAGSSLGSGRPLPQPIG
jgi:RNA polymerase sigma-70 factor (ECF subfamily)